MTETHDNTEMQQDEPRTSRPNENASKRNTQESQRKSFEKLEDQNPIKKHTQNNDLQLVNANKRKDKAEGRT